MGNCFCISEHRKEIISGRSAEEYAVDYIENAPESGKGCAGIFGGGGALE
jgi:hypothetical protein